MSKIFSSEKDFKGYLDPIKEWFSVRGYSENIANEEIVEVFLAFLFLVTLIKDLPSFLYSDEEVQKIFFPSPMVSYRRARKNKRLKRSRLHPLERNVDCGDCGNYRYTFFFWRNTFSKAGSMFLKIFSIWAWNVS